MLHILESQIIKGKFLEWSVDEGGMSATGWDGCVCWHDMSGHVDGSRILEFADRLNLH